MSTRVEFRWVHNTKKTNSRREIAQSKHYAKHTKCVSTKLNRCTKTPYQTKYPDQQSIKVSSGNKFCSLQTKYRDKYHTQAVSNSSGIEVSSCVFRKLILLAVDYIPNRYYSLTVSIFSDVEAK